MSDESKHSAAATGAGNLLRAQRERQGLSQHEAAAGLNLRPAIIEALEADRYDLLPPRTFVRGYLRAYAKLLGLKEHDVLAAFERQQPEPDAERVRPAVSGDRQQQRSPWLKWLVLLIALLLVAYVASQTYFQAPIGAEDAASEGRPAQPVAPADPAARQFVPDPEPMAAPASADDPSDVMTPAQEAASQAAEPAPAAGLEQPAPEAESLAEPAVQFTEASSNATPVLAAPQAPATPQAARARISIEINEESWVEVTGASGQRLHAALVQGPRTLEFNGRPPLRLVIGNAQNARLYYADEQISLTPYTRREVARLTVPLPQ